MNFFKRAILSTKSRWSKTLLLFTVITTICVLVLSGISIQTASKNAGILARQQLGATVTLKVDTEKMRENMMKSKDSASSSVEPGGERMKPTMTPLPTEYIDQLKDSEYVESYLAQSSTSLLANDFTAVGSENEESSSSTQSSDKNMPQMDQGKMGRNMGDVTLTGVSNLEQTSSFRDGNISIVEGDSITEETASNSVIIEEALASENDLSVGDTINVSSTSDEETTYDLKIIGIYASSEDFTEQAMRDTASSPYNNIYTSLETISEIKGSDYENAVDSAVFYLNDPVNVDAFIAESEKTNIDFDTFKLDANDSAYEQMLGPIENISSFSKIAVFVIAIAGGLILTLIIMLSIRDRNQEIGILLSLGEKKSKIIAQFAVEILLVLVLSLGVSSVIGNSTSNLIANQLLTSEISSSENSDEANAPEMPGGDRGQNKGFGGMFSPTRSNVEVIDELDVSVSGQDFLKMSGLGVAISLVATCVPAVTVMRLNPKNILSKHS